MAMTQGVHHIGLTVPDITATRNLFVNVLGFKQVGERPAYPAFFVSDGTVMLTLWQATEPDSAIPFDRKNNIGLHHLALKVKDIDALNEVYQSLAKTEDIKIEFAPELSGNGPAQHLMAYIPGGIRLELVASGQ